MIGSGATSTGRHDAESGALDYEAHLRALRPRLPHAGFHVVIEPPFVVVGDEAPAIVEERAERTIRWAVRLLKKAYFTKNPDHVIDVWLFKDKQSYEKHVKLLFGTTPGTPFGYYSPSDKALVMNISTGGGTLVHEIVHPFVAANFPDCPAWLNEGLGSLYEQCNESAGRIVGLTNWRLSGLQDALRRDKVPSFAELCAMSDHAFYNEDRGTNYAQARYLCYYLQEEGLLRQYYSDFYANRKADPDGYQTLVAILGKPDMAEFATRWSEFVLRLRF